ncbi:MAG: type IV pilus assembly protein PilM [Clostridium sartagoforme]|nr:type IV pilus assembly protein PilM [Clostridium sartagoforme]
MPINLSKLKEISSMDVKDIGKLFKKKEAEDLNSSYEVNKVEREPKFKERGRSVLSIDLGSNTIKLVEGKFSKNKLTLNKAIQIPTPDGCLADGKILNVQAVVDIVSFLIKENGVKAKDVIFTTNSSSIINRDITIPIVQEDEMETVIRYEIQQYLPINLDDYIIQFIVLDEIVDDIGAKLKVNVTAFPEKMAFAYYSVINTLDLNPYALDVTYNSINKIANYAEYTGNKGQVIGGTVAFIDMGATSTNVTIFKNGKLDFTRIIKSGGDNIDYSLSQSLNMSVKSTESVKIKDGNILSYNEEDTLNLTIRRSVDEILEELERIIQFYNNKSNSSIDKIYIYGGMSNLNNINLYMKNKLSIEIVKIDTITNIDITSNELINENLGQFLNAIGAIIRL